MTDESTKFDDEVRSASAQKTSRGWLFLVAILAAAALVAAIVVISFDKRTYYFTVAEAAPQLVDLRGQRFRLKGMVEQDSHLIREGTLDQHRFTLTESGAQIVVDYQGPLPDTFTDESDRTEVVAVGTLRDDGIFEAEEVSAKCPSRYEGGAPTAESQ